MKNVLKRCLSLLLTVLILLSFVPVNTVKATSNKIITVTQTHSAICKRDGKGIPIFHIHYVSEVNSIAGVEEGRVTYCVDRRRQIHTETDRNVTETSADIEATDWWTSLSDDQKFYIKRALLYGYSGVEAHSAGIVIDDEQDESLNYYNDSAWRGATQCVLWDMTRMSDGEGLTYDNAPDGYPYLAGCWLFTNRCTTGNHATPKPQGWRGLSGLSSMNSLSCYKRMDAATKAEYEWIVGAIDNHTKVPVYNGVAGSNPGANTGSLTYSQISSSSYVSTVTSTGSFYLTDSTAATKYLMTGTTNLKVIYEDSRDAVADAGNSGGNVGAVNVWHESGSQSIKVNVLRPMHGRFAIRVSKGPADADKNTLHMQFSKTNQLENYNAPQTTVFGHAKDPYYAYYKFNTSFNVDLEIEKTFDNSVIAGYQWKNNWRFAVTSNQSQAEGAYANMEVKEAIVQGTSDSSTDKYITVEYSTVHTSSNPNLYVWMVYSDNGGPLSYSVRSGTTNQITIPYGTSIPVGSKVYYTVTNWNPNNSNWWSGLTSGNTGKLTISGLTPNTTYYIVEPKGYGWAGGVRTVTTGSSGTSATTYQYKNSRDVDLVVEKAFNEDTVLAGHMWKPNWHFAVTSSESNANSAFQNMTQHTATVQRNTSEGYNYIDVEASKSSAVGSEWKYVWGVYYANGCPVSFFHNASDPSNRIRVGASASYVGQEISYTLCTWQFNNLSNFDGGSKATNSDGKATFENLKPNTTYYVIEPPGPGWAGGVKSVTLAGNSRPVVTFEYENGREASLSIIKSFNTSGIANAKKKNFAFVVSDNEEYVDNVLNNIHYATGTVTSGLLDISAITADYYTKSSYLYNVYDKDGYPIAWTRDTNGAKVNVGTSYNGQELIFVWSNYANCNDNGIHLNNRALLGFTGRTWAPGGTIADGTYGVKFPDLKPNTTYYIGEIPGPMWASSKYTKKTSSFGNLEVTHNNTRTYSQITVRKALGSDTPSNAVKSRWAMFLVPYNDETDIANAEAIKNSLNVYAMTIPANQGYFIARGSVANRQDFVYAVYDDTGKPIAWSRDSEDTTRINITATSTERTIYFAWSGTKTSRDEKWGTIDWTDSSGVATFTTCKGMVISPKLKYAVIEAPGPGWQAKIITNIVVDAPGNTAYADVTNNSGYVTLSKTVSSFGSNASTAGYRFMIKDSDNNWYYGESDSSGAIVRKTSNTYATNHADGSKFYGIFNGSTEIYELAREVNGVPLKPETITVTEYDKDGVATTTTYRGTQISTVEVSGNTYYKITHNFTKLTAGGRATIAIGNKPITGKLAIAKYVSGMVTSDNANGYGFRVGVVAGGTTYVPGNTAATLYRVTANQGSGSDYAWAYESDSTYTQTGSSAWITGLYNGKFNIEEDITFGPAVAQHVRPTKIVVRQYDANGEVVSEVTYTGTNIKTRIQNGHTYVGLQNVELTTITGGGFVRAFFYNEEDTAKARVVKKMSDGSNVDGTFNFKVEYKYPSPTQSSDAWVTAYSESNPLVITGDGTSAQESVDISINGSVNIPVGTLIRVTELSHANTTTDSTNPQTVTLTTKGATYSVTFINTWKPSAIRVTKSIVNGSTGELVTDTTEGWTFIAIRKDASNSNITFNIREGTVSNLGRVTTVGPTGNSSNYVYATYDQYGKPINFNRPTGTTIYVGTQYAGQTIYYVYGDVLVSDPNISIAKTDSTGVALFENLSRETTYYIYEALAPSWWVTATRSEITTGEGGTTSIVSKTNTKKEVSIGVDKEFTSDSVNTDYTSWRFYAYLKSAGNVDHQYYNVAEGVSTATGRTVQKSWLGIADSSIVVDELWVDGVKVTIKSSTSTTLTYSTSTAAMHKGSYLWARYHYNTNGAVNPETLSGAHLLQANSQESLSSWLTGEYWIEEVPQYGYKGVNRQSFTYDGTKDIEIAFNGVNANDNGGLFSLSKTVSGGGALQGIHFVISKEEAKFNVYQAILSDDNAAYWDETSVAVGIINNGCVATSNPVYAVYVNDELVKYNGSITTSGSDANRRITGLNLKAGDKVFIVVEDTPLSAFTTSLIGDYTTDAQGKITENLQTGSYWVVEVPSPKYEIVNGEWVTVTQSAVTKSYTNVPVSSGGIPVHKGFLDPRVATDYRHWFFIAATDNGFGQSLKAVVVPFIAGADTMHMIPNPFNVATATVLCVYCLNEDSDYYEEYRFTQSSTNASTIRLTGRFNDSNMYALIVSDSTYVEGWAQANASNGYAYIDGLEDQTYYWVHEAKYADYLEQTPQRVLATHIEDSNGYLGDPSLIVHFDENNNHNNIPVTIEKAFAPGTTGNKAGWEFAVVPIERKPASGRMFNIIGFHDTMSVGTDLQTFDLKSWALAVNGDEPAKIYRIYNDSLAVDLSGRDYSFNPTTGILTFTETTEDLQIDSGFYVVYEVKRDDGVYTTADDIIVTDSNGLSVGSYVVGTTWYIEEIPVEFYVKQAGVEYTVTSEDNQKVTFTNVKQQTSAQVQKALAGNTERGDSVQGWAMVLSYNGAIPVKSKQIVVTAATNTLDLGEFGYYGFTEDQSGYEVTGITTAYGLASRYVRRSSDFTPGTYTVYYVSTERWANVVSTTNASGIATFNNLPNVSVDSNNHYVYYVTEVPKYGWEIKDPAQLDVKLGNNGAYNGTYVSNKISLTNRRETFIEITKKDDNNALLPNMFFYVREEEDVDNYGYVWRKYEYSLPADGSSSINLYSKDSNLAMVGGNYVFVYVNNTLLDPSNISWTNGVLNFNINNTLVLKKNDTIRIIYAVNVPIVAGDHSGVTGSDGKILIKLSSAGTYYVEERPVEGYEYFIPQKITVEQGKTNKFTFTNVLEEGTYGIIKTYYNPITKEEYPENNMTFRIYPEVYGSYDNSPVDLRDLVDEPENSDGSYVTKVLPYGRYVVEQLTGKDDYSLLDSYVININEEHKNDEVEKVNVPNPGGLLEVYKTDTSGRPLSNVGYLLEYAEPIQAPATDYNWKPIKSLDLTTYDPEGMVYPIGTTTTQGVVNGILYTKPNGYAAFEGLNANHNIRYRLTEVKAADGKELLADIVWEGYLPVRTVYDNLDDYNAWWDLYTEDYWSANPMKTSGTLSYNDNVGALIDVKSDGATVDVYKHNFHVINTSLFKMPETGAEGTTIYGVVGIWGIALVVMYLILKRRRKSEML